MNKTVFNIKSILIIITAFFVLTFIGFRIYKTKDVFNDNRYRVIIDAGHGLPDGGAVATDGTIESDINLAIAQKLNERLTLAGIECIMIRNDENSVCTEGNTIHAKKVSDIRNRVSIANQNSDALLISIHMNTYTTPDVHGAQVFFKSGSELSKELAEEIQRAINLKFQPDNTKVSKPISSNIYLFNHINNDCILIECGFMTNVSDLAKLKDVSYQQELASTIAEVIIYKLTGSEFNGS